MRKLYLGNGDKQFKFADTTTEIHLNAFDNGSAAALTADAKVRIKNKSGYLLEISASVTDNHAVITSGQLAQLPAGAYLLELWDTVDSGTAIYPSDGFLALQINENVTGLSGGLVSSITVDDFVQQFGSLSEQLKQQVSDAVANGLKGDKGDKGDTGTVDNAGLTKAPAFVSLQTQVDNNAQELLENYDYTENRLYIDGLEKDKYIDKSGNIKDWSGWDLSDYLPVEKNEIYVWTSDIPVTDKVPAVSCGLFDVNKKYIGSGNQDSDTFENKSFINTDSNTAYVRISQDSKYFTNNAMMIRKALYDQGIKEFIPFKRYLKYSPTKEIEQKTDSIEEKTDSFDTNYQPNYDNVVRSIQRIGEGMEHPIHSVESFKDAYRKGFRILLCDLIFTSDNVPVCNHDSYLNQLYKNVYDSNGALVSIDNPVYFSQNTYATLSKYNYGAMGYPLLKFIDMLKLVKQLGVELYVEVKGMTEQQAKIACSLVRQFGLSDKTSWAGDTSEQMNWVIANIDTARVSLMPSDITDDVIKKLNSLKTGKNKVFIFGWNNTILTDEIVNKLMQNDIAFEQGTPNTEKDIKNYFARGDQYYYCTGIETNAVIAGKVMLESSLSNAE